MLIRSLPKQESPLGMLEATAPYEQRFGAVFETLTWFPSPVLEKMHASPNGKFIPPDVVVASATKPHILEHVRTLTSVANLATPDREDRLAYREAVESILLALPGGPDAFKHVDNALFVAPRREGALIASRLGFMEGEHGFMPDAKRVPFDSGLLVALSKIPEYRRFSKCILIDGAIATGTTLVSLMERLAPRVDAFRVYAAHSTVAGLWALQNYAAAAQLDFSCVVGDASGKLNGKFYAEHPNTHMLVLGDVGDIIVPICER